MESTTDCLAVSKHLVSWLVTKISLLWGIWTASVFVVLVWCALWWKMASKGVEFDVHNGVYYYRKLVAKPAIFLSCVCLFVGWKKWVAVVCVLISGGGSVLLTKGNCYVLFLGCCVSFYSFYVTRLSLKHAKKAVTVFGCDQKKSVFDVLERSYWYKGLWLHMDVSVRTFYWIYYFFSFRLVAVCLFSFYLFFLSNEVVFIGEVFNDAWCTVSFFDRPLYCVKAGAEVVEVSSLFVRTVFSWVMFNSGITLALIKFLTKNKSSF